MYRLNSCRRTQQLEYVDFPWRRGNAIREAAGAKNNDAAMYPRLSLAAFFYRLSQHTARKMDQRAQRLIGALVEANDHRRGDEEDEGRVKGRKVAVG